MNVYAEESLDITITTNWSADRKEWWLTVENWPELAAISTEVFLGAEERILSQVDGYLWVHTYVVSARYRFLRVSTTVPNILLYRRVELQSHKPLTFTEEPESSVRQ